MSYRDVLYAMSLYSPIIINLMVLFFSATMSHIDKGLIYLFWIFVITFLRVGSYKLYQNMIKPTSSTLTTPPNCVLSDMFISNDVTYSTYILTFTLFYFIMPMILISQKAHTNIVNYYVVFTFVFYIVYDLFVKYSLLCFSNYIPIIADIVLGAGLGALIAGVIMYGTSLSSYLFIQEVNSNREVCKMENKQQFKCNVYKNGELIS